MSNLGRPLCYSVGISLFVITHWLPSIGQAQDSIAATLTEASRQWERLIDAYSRIRIVGNSKTMEGAKIVTVETIYECNGDLRLVNVTMPERGKAVACIGPSYRFRIQKLDDETAFAINGYGKLLPVEQHLFDATYHYLYQYAERYLHSLWTIEGFTLSELLFPPYGKVTAVEAIDEKAEQAIRIYFEFTPDDPRMTSFHPPSYVTLRPDQCWAIVDYRCVLGAAKYVQIGFIHYDGEIAAGIPKLKNVKFGYMKGGLPDATLADEFEVESLESVRLPNSHFTLSAFGLPEPGLGATGLRLPIWAWTLFFSLTLLLTAVMLRRRQQRT